MINLQANITVNVIGVALMIILLLGTRAKPGKLLFDQKIFFFMTIFTIHQCICETVAFCIDGKLFPGAHTLAVILNMLLFIVNILFAFLWTAYVDYKLFEDRNRIRKIYPIVSIPALVICAMSLCNLFTDVFFTVSADNIYIRTGLVWLPYAVTYLYLIYTVVLLYRYRKKVEKYLFLPIISFLIPIFIGSLLQFFIYGLSLVWVSVAVALVSVYINIQNEEASIDSLTGLYNRQYLNRYLVRICSGAPFSEKRLLVGIMLDIDSFKRLNDTYGHLAGDQVLREVGPVLRNASSPFGIATRYAGDEFVILVFLDNIEQINVLTDNIQERIRQLNKTSNRPFEISLSMGEAIFHPGQDTIDTFLNRMDQCMYRNKKRAAAVKRRPVFPDS